MSSLLRGLSNKEYHSGEGVYSSSQLKTILEDPEVFYKKYISKEIPREELAVFDIGTYFHTAVLEPHLLEEECAVFEGIRRGKAWEQFKEMYSHKTIITKTEYDTAMGLVHSVRNSKIAMNYIDRAEAEVSAFVTLDVAYGAIYAEGKFRLDIFKGWVLEDKYPGQTTKITVKCRADSLGDSYILDLKSTSGNVKNEYEMRNKISKYSYDLSAAMYLDIFTIAAESIYDTFIWTFASKDTNSCKSYVASKENIQVGRSKWIKAILEIVKYTKIDWKIEDTLGILNPNYYEHEWLKIKEEDEL